MSGIPRSGAATRSWTSPRGGGRTGGGPRRCGSRTSPEGRRCRPSGGAGAARFADAADERALADRRPPVGLQPEDRVAAGAAGKGICRRRAETGVVVADDARTFRRVGSVYPYCGRSCRRHNGHVVCAHIAAYETGRAQHVEQPRDALRLVRRGRRLHDGEAPPPAPPLAHEREEQLVVARVEALRVDKDRLHSGAGVTRT